MRLSDVQKKQLKRVAVTMAGLFLIFYVSYQVYLGSFEKVDTQTAVEKTVNDSISAKGFFIRDEQYITNSAGGTVVPVAKDGSRVSAGNTVAIAFSSDEAAALYSRIEVLESELERYKALSAVSPSAGVDAQSLYSKINGSISELVDGISSGRLDELSEQYALLRDSITKKQLAFGEKMDFKGIIDGLNAELSALDRGTVKSQKITASKTGYYVNKVDGCEGFYNYDDIKKITPDEVDSLFSMQPKPISGDVMGKTVNSFNWYVVCNLPIKRISGLQPGNTVHIAFPYSGIEPVKATVKAVNVKGADTAAVVLCCNVMNEELANMRAEDIEIVFGEITGFVVPTRAVREVDGVKGVYILRSNSVTFRKINVMWTSDEYLITADKYERVKVEIPPKDGEGEPTYEYENKLVAQSEVRLYDEIIVKGKNLYDGKAIS